MNDVADPRAARGLDPARRGPKGPRRRARRARASSAPAERPRTLTVGCGRLAPSLADSVAGDWSRRRDRTRARAAIARTGSRVRPSRLRSLLRSAVPRSSRMRVPVPNALLRAPARLGRRARPARRRGRPARRPHEAGPLRVLGGEGLLALPAHAAAPARRTRAAAGSAPSKGDCSSKERPDGLGRRLHGLAEAAVLLEAPRGVVGHHVLGVPARHGVRRPATGSRGSPTSRSSPQAAQAARRSRATRPKKPMMVGWSEHFYLATDIPRLKLLTQGGAPRVADQHELVHLFLERAEKAYDDFVAVWGADRARAGKTGHLPRRPQVEDGELAGRLLRQREDEHALRRGLGTVARRLLRQRLRDCRPTTTATTATCTPTCRHMIGHLLFSMLAQGRSRRPTTARSGRSRAPPTGCARSTRSSSTGPSSASTRAQGSQGSGKDWDQKARAIAAGRRDPIEKLFAIASESHMTTDDHIRSWSYMDVMLREDRERWLDDAARASATGRTPRRRSRQGLGMSPDEFDKRWADRLLGKRKTMVDVPEGREGPRRRRPERRPRAAASRRSRTPDALAALIRGPRPRRRREDGRARPLEALASTPTSCARRSSCCSRRRRSPR